MLSTQIYFNASSNNVLSIAGFPAPFEAFIPCTMKNWRSAVLPYL